jgi:hypothetical protein
MLAVAGGSDMLSAVFRNTMLQLATPDELRGRVTSIHALVVTSGPRVGDIQSSLVAAVIGPGQAVVAGGLLCLAGIGAVVRVLPELPAHVIGRRRRSSDSEVRVVHQPDTIEEHEIPVPDKPARRL